MEVLMKTLILTLFLTISSMAVASTQTSAQSYSFQFKTQQNKKFTITSVALSKELAFKLAAKECFNKLTGNKYPGEEKGLEIIDICANPKL